jgi:cytoplasmic tRNA 2-thiolation protein 2
MLDKLRERQLSKYPHRGGFDIYVLVIDPSTISPQLPSVQAHFDAAKENYPSHTYSIVPLHDIFDVDPAITNTLRDFGFVDDESKSGADRLDCFRASISTATARADLDNLLLIRLVVAYARKFDCEAVVWGDSDSRLAAKTLANVAKGRGISLTWQIRDGPSPWGIRFCFPLRELYRSELDLYVKLNPKLQSVVVPASQEAESLSARDLSIDALMNQYIVTHGEKYPGVMANVVRTADKLQQDNSPSSDPVCSMCSAPLQGHGSIAVNGNDTNRLCYACLRSRDDIRVSNA